MAITVNNIFGAETGGLDELTFTNGTVAADATVFRTGLYSLKLTGLLGFSIARLPLEETGSASAGNNYGGGFAVRFSNLGSLGLYTFFGYLRDGGAVEFSLNLGLTGDLILADANNATTTLTNPFVNNTWYYISYIYNRSNTGNFKLYIDGVQVMNVSGDFLASTVSLANYAQFQSGIALQDVWIDDLYLASGLTSEADLFLNAYVTKSYSKTDGTGTDVGSALTTGTWANVSQVPLNAANTAVYNAGVKGAMNANTGTKSGPVGDTSIPANSTAIVSKYMIRALRSSGSGSTHLHRIGTNGSVSEFTVSLATSYTHFNRISTSAINLTSDYMTNGFGSNAGGAQSMTTAEMWSTVLYTVTARRRVSIS